MDKIICKKDIYLVLGFVCLGFLLWRALGSLRLREGGSVIIKSHGELLATYPLSQDQIVEINEGSNILEIKDGKAKMIHADCRDKICVKHQAVSRTHESIVCLPNGIIVEVMGNEASEYDAVAQ